MIPPIAFIYLKVSNYYLLSSRELKRFDSNSCSPIFTQFSETLAGVSTVRAYGAEDRFEKMNEKKIDDNHKPFHFVWVANRWLSIRIELISVFVVFFAGLAIVFSDVSPAMAGLVLMHAADFADVALWGARNHAEIEMSMNSGKNLTYFKYCEIEQSLLQGNKIIFLDEATASVDNDTDAKIQTTIRTEFADRTIVCIAHRLRTVIDYDKILVLDKGKVLEFGTPLELINLNGTFRSMCEETGEYEELHAMATNASGFSLDI